MITIFTPLHTDAVGIADTIRAVAHDATKPVLAAVFGDAQERLREGRDMPVFTFPEAAAYALGTVTDYAAWRRRDPGTVVMPADMNLSAAREIVRRVLAANPEGCQLGPLDAAALMKAIAVPVAMTTRADTADEAVAVGRDLRLPGGPQGGRPQHGPQDRARRGAHRPRLGAGAADRLRHHAGSARRRDGRRDRPADAGRGGGDHRRGGA